MKNLVRYCTTALEAFTSVLLFVLTVMVFLNVVLRYGFNSGITVTEELGRYLFVWLVFGGAVLAAGTDSHVRVDMFIRLLPRVPRAVIDIICDAIMLYCCYLITVGGYVQTVLNTSNYLAVSGLPVSWLYATGMLCGLLIGLILLVRMIGRIAGLGKPAPAENAKGERA